MISCGSVPGTVPGINTVFLPVPEVPYGIYTGKYQVPVQDW